MAVLSSIIGLVAIAIQTWSVGVSASSFQTNITAVTDNVKSDWASVYYSLDAKPLLFGSDGGPNKGGFHVYDLMASPSPHLPELTSRVTGRSKLVTVVHGVGRKDFAVNIAAPDSVIRVFELPELRHVEEADFKALGAWSALCAWRAPTGNNYIYLLGKGKGVQYILQYEANHVKIVEVQTFDVPFEASGCAASPTRSCMYLQANDTKTVYAFPLEESTKAPRISKAGESDQEVTGLAVYVVKDPQQDLLFIAQEDVVAIYDDEFHKLAEAKLGGFKDIEVEGLSMYQGSTSEHPLGVLAFAIESDEANGFGIAPLDEILQESGVVANTKYDPRTSPLASDASPSPICDRCSGNGYCFENKNATAALKQCDCFSGFSGDTCTENTCTNDCSGRGRCVGPNSCECDQGWGGLHCSFLLVEPLYETDESGDDGDDPAIWVSPVSREQSRVITTTKSGQGAGLGVFDLSGQLLQHFPMGKPNNVDMIYGFQAGNRTIDLAFAACRTDNTLCFAEMQPNGTLVIIAGGSQPIVDDYKPYGSCTYKSLKTGKQYLFVNEKSARYLQYELTATPNGTLETTLVRDFQGGGGGQVEGCVSDEENGWLFLGEEPSALWRYGAEPDNDTEGIVIGRVGDGNLYGDVEGVTLVQGSTPDKGFILVSCQGVSAYNIYRRAAPHEFVATFTIVETADRKVDAVSNTDGLTAIGTGLNGDFPHGLLVVHDDANQLPDGSTSALASFKLVSLESILGAHGLAGMELLQDVDKDWDPRA